MLPSARAPGACSSLPFTRRAELVEHRMLTNLFRVCRWSASCSALLLFGCEQTDTLHCVPGESVACVGAGDCAGTKVCDTSGIVFGSCMCPIPLSDPGPRSSNPPPSGCERGDTRACLGPDACEGVATCGDSGTFGACKCTQSEIPLPSLRPNVLGAACRNGSECGSSLTCWAQYEDGPSGLGGPVGGYCTAACRGPADCTLFQQPSDCWLAAGATFGVCLATCSDPASTTGCGGRAELACATYAALSLVAPASQSADPALCVPHCQSDAECGERHCDTSGPVSTCVGGPDAGVANAVP